MMSLGKRAAGLRLERMQASPLWTEAGFRNQYPIPTGLRDTTAARPTLREFVCAEGRRVPQGLLPTVDPRERWARKPDSGLRATWLGHSSVLIEIDGLRVLTDPVWGPRASPSRLIGPKRFQKAPVRLSQLPPIDVVVISHDHYDHLDYPTIRQMAKTNMPFVTSLGVGAHLQAWGIAPERITELDCWQSHRVSGTDLSIHAAPSQHVSGRSLKDRNATLWSSLVLRTARHRVFFSGDTGLTTEYELIRQRRNEPGLEERDDILSMLLTAHDEDGKPMTDVEIRDELVTLIVAAITTLVINSGLPPGAAAIGEAEEPLLLALSQILGDPHGRHQAHAEMIAVGGPLLFGAGVHVVASRHRDRRDAIVVDQEHTPRPQLVRVAERLQPLKGDHDILSLIHISSPRDS